MCWTKAPQNQDNYNCFQIFQGGKKPFIPANKVLNNFFWKDCKLYKDRDQ